ncbi:hypothetical protein ACPC54_13365 [Kitasatospora sp. NPDC094028]
MSGILNSTGWHYDAQTGLTTRNLRPTLRPGMTVSEALDLPEDELRRAIAMHEAGHATVMLHFGLPFKSVAIRDDLGLDPDRPGNAGEVACESWSAPLCDGLAMLAAGERAQDRWLRESGRWSVARGWLTELGAIGDRREVYRAVREAFGVGVTFNTGDDPCRDLSALHDHADALLNTLWGQVGRLADVLDRRGRLTEAQAAEAAGFARRLSGGAR